MNESETIQIHEESRDEAMILRPVGDIDLARSPAVHQALVTALQQSPSRLVLNLSEVPYMDSSGVATFIEAMKIASGQNCSLILCEMQDRVRSIFEIARLDAVFTITADTDTALAT